VALSQGDAARAETELRLAAFGLLDEPERLVVALAHLALADQAAGDTAGLDATLQRLLAVERSFAAWAAADLPPAARARVEAALAERVPEAGLASVPSLAAVARRRAAERLAAMPPAERRRELLARTAAEPDAALWQVMLGQLDLAAGDTANAAARAQRALAAQPSADEAVAARCLRGTALARAGSCAAAVGDLEACPAARREPEPAQLLLQCHARLGQWRQAKAFADTLPPAIKSRRETARLVRQVEAEVGRLPAAPPAAAPSPAAVQPPAAAAPPAADALPAAEALPTADQARLARARVLMGEAKRAGDLAEALALAVAVADAHPRSAEAQHLAGEIAYRASRWAQAATYLRRGGPSDAQPELAFYLAVALWESGERQEAARVLETALPRLPRNEFVDGYAERILGRPR
jgi:predicted Zn-dependent protease